MIQRAICAIALVFMVAIPMGLQAEQVSKIYVEADQLHFLENGMFVKNLEGKLIAIKDIGYDSQGYFLTQEHSFLSELDQAIMMTEYKNNYSSLGEHWQCPYCYRWWLLGERCSNPDCPTNRW